MRGSKKVRFNNGNMDGLYLNLRITICLYYLFWVSLSKAVSANGGRAPVVRHVPRGYGLGVGLIRIEGLVVLHVADDEQRCIIAVHC